MTTNANAPTTMNVLFCCDDYGCDVMYQYDSDGLDTHKYILHSEYEALQLAFNDRVRVIEMQLEDKAALQQQVAVCVSALKQAEEWLNGWASAEPQLKVIRAALSQQSKG